jgi:hypothetical protein
VAARIRAGPTAVNGRRSTANRAGPADSLDCARAGRPAAHGHRRVGIAFTRSPPAARRASGDGRGHDRAGMRDRAAAHLRDGRHRHAGPRSPRDRSPGPGARSRRRVDRGCRAPCPGAGDRQLVRPNRLDAPRRPRTLLALPQRSTPLPRALPAHPALQPRGGMARPVVEAVGRALVPRADHRVHDPEPWLRAGGPAPGWHAEGQRIPPGFRDAFAMVRDVRGSAIHRPAQRPAPARAVRVRVRADAQAHGRPADLGRLGLGGVHGACQRRAAADGLRRPGAGDVRGVRRTLRAPLAPARPRGLAGCGGRSPSPRA